MAEDDYGMSAGASRDCGFQSYRLRLSIVPAYSKPRPQTRRPIRNLPWIILLMFNQKIGGWKSENWKEVSEDLSRCCSTEA